MKVILLGIVTLAILNSVLAISEVCDTDADCNDLNYERCQHFDSCSKGACVCKEKYYFSDGICKTVTALGATCNNDTVMCGVNAHCTTVCVCYAGFSKDPDGINCLSDYSLLEGVKCDAASALCDSTRGLECVTEGANQLCRCTKGSSQFKLGVKVDGPNGRRIAACVHPRTKLNLEEGAPCNSPLADLQAIPYKLCGAGLACGYCPEWDQASNTKQEKCLKMSYNSAITTSFSAILLLNLVSLWTLA